MNKFDSIESIPQRGIVQTIKGTPEQISRERYGLNWEKGAGRLDYQIFLLSLVVFGTAIGCLGPGIASELSPDADDDMGGDDLGNDSELTIPMGTAIPEMGDVGKAPVAQTYVSPELGMAVSHFYNVDDAGNFTGLYGHAIVNDANLEVVHNDNGTTSVTLGGNDFGDPDSKILGNEGYSAQEKIDSVEMQSWLDTMIPSEANAETVDAIRQLLSENPNLQSTVTVDTTYNLDSSSNQLKDMGLTVEIIIGDRVFVLESKLDAVTQMDVLKGWQIASVDADFDGSAVPVDVVFNYVPDTWSNLGDGVHVSPEFMELRDTMLADSITLTNDGVLEYDGEPVPNVQVMPDGSIYMIVGEDAIPVEAGDIEIDEDGVKIKGYELDENDEWVEAMSKSMQQTNKLIETYGLEDEIVEGKITVTEEGGAVNVVDEETGKVLIRTIGENSKYDLRFAVDTIAANSCESTGIKPGGSGGVLSEFQKQFEVYRDLLLSEAAFERREGQSIYYLLTHRDKQCWALTNGKNLAFRDASLVIHNLALLDTTKEEIRAVQFSK